MRELENLIHREFLLGDEPELRIDPPADLEEHGNVTDLPDREVADLCYRDAKSRALQEFDRAYLTQMVKRTRGNVTKAAQLAGKERRAFGKLLKRYQITRPAIEDTAPN